MKYTKLIIAFALLIIAVSCSKEEVDQRDKYIGTWKGNTTLTVPALSISESMAITQIVTKSETNPNAILFTEENSIESSTAIVNGNSYTYEDYTYTETIEGQTTAFEVSGIGSIDGTVISESGTIIVYLMGGEFSGSWTCILNKQ